MATANEIVARLATERTAERLIVRLMPSMNEVDRQDFAQEIYLIVLEMDADMLTALQQRGKLFQYFYSVVKYQLNVRTSVCRKKLNLTNAQGTQQVSIDDARIRDKGFYPSEYTDGED